MTCDGHRHYSFYECLNPACALITPPMRTQAANAVRGVLVLVTTLLVANTGSAKPRAVDDIVVEGTLTYEKFANTVRCGSPHKKCNTVKWNRRRITVAFVAPECNKGKCSAVSSGLSGAQQALKSAIREIHRTGAAIRLLIRPPGSKADITVFMGNPVQKGWRGYSSPQNAGEFIYWMKHRRIHSAQIRISKRISGRHLRSVMLEELVQSLGFPYDIHHEKAIGEQSIFSAQYRWHKKVTRLNKWDARLLRSVYGRRKK